MTPNLLSTFARLRTDASVEMLPVGADFWQKISTGALGDFHNEYLVSCYDFDSSWNSWEKHPNGDEIVCLLQGAVEFVLDADVGEQRITLCEPGAFFIVPKNSWHTADVAAPARVLFITAGEGTQHRAR